MPTMGLHYAPNLITTRWQRLKASLFPILQIGVAAGFANLIAVHLFSHHQPFFAPMAAVIVLGLTGGDRLRRAVELNIGVSLGVGVGDLFVGHFGTGWWQMPLLVMASLAVAVFLGKGPLMATQAALGSVLIATIMPPGTSGGSSRMLDAFVGGFIGVIVIALMPTSPLKGGRMEISKVLALTASTLAEVAAAIPEQDDERIQRALKKARGSQANINSMIAAAKEGEESVAVSPLLWRHKRRIKSLVRILNPVDNAMRNTRVLSRRALTLVEDHDTVSEEQLWIISSLADIAGQLAELYTKSGDLDEHVAIPELVRRLRELGARAGLDVAEGGVLTAQVILAQSRSIIVDLLQVCGMSRYSAVAVLQPTSEHPAMPPEVRD